MPYHTSRPSHGTWILLLHPACLHLATPTLSIQSMHHSRNPSLRTLLSDVSRPWPPALRALRSRRYTTPDMPADLDYSPVFYEYSWGSCEPRFTPVVI